MELNRRTFIKTAAACSAALGITPALRAAPPKTAGNSRGKRGDDGPVLQIGDNIAVAETNYGRVRGFILNGITAFRASLTGRIRAVGIDSCHRKNRRPGRR